MDPQRYERIKDLFHQVVTLPPDEVPAFLDRACADAPALRREVEALLGAARTETSFLERPALGDELTSALAEPRAPRLPGQIGPWTVEGLLGAGAMGIVYLGRRPGGEPAAVKVLREEFATARSRRRFEREVAALRGLDHPGIARFLEAGVETGPLGERPWFAMEYVEGRSITEAAAAFGQEIAPRLELLEQVAEAVQHAHDAGVIHRDLKPGNVLVDGEGRVRVLDFGVARLTGTDPGATTLRTDTGQLVGTLSYMSPEQVAGVSGDVDGRADEYALAVLAYEVLAGRRPYDVESAERIGAALEVIRDEDPVPLGLVDPRFAGPVSTVVARGMEKDRRHRYPTVGELGAELGRARRGEALLARPPSLLRRWWRRERRRPARLAVRGLLAVLGVGALVSWIVISAGGRRLDAAHLLEGAATELEPHPALSLSLALAAQEAVPGAEGRDALFAALEASRERAVHREQGEAVRALASGASGLLATVGAEGVLLRGVDGLPLEDGAELEGRGAAVFTPAGDRLLTLRASSVTGTAAPFELVSYRVSTGEPSARILPRGDDGARYERPLLALLPGGERLFVAAVGVAPVLFSLPGLERAGAPRVGGTILPPAWDRRGELLVLAEERGVLHVLRAGDGDELASTRREPTGMEAVAMDPFARWIAVVDGAGRVRLLRAPFEGTGLVPGERLPTEVDDAVALVACPDGDLITGHGDGSVRRWDPGTREQTASWRPASGAVRRLFVDPAGERLLVHGGGGSLGLVDLRVGRERGRLVGHTDTVVDVVWLDGGEDLWTASHDGTLRRWSVPRPEQVFDAGGGEDLVDPEVFAASGGGRLVTRVRDEATRELVLQDRAGNLLHRWGDHGNAVHAVAFSGDGRLAASADENGQVLVWETLEGQPPRRLAATKGKLVHTLEFLPGGELLVVAGVEQLGTFDLSTGVMLPVLGGGEVRGTQALAASADGRRLAAAGAGGRVVVYAVDGRQIGAVAEHQLGGDVRALAFDGEGGHLACGTITGRVVVFDLDDPGARAESFLPHAAPVTALAFASDEVLVTGGDEGRVAAWAWRRQVSVDTFDRAAPVISLEATGEGQVVVGWWDGTLSRWSPGLGPEQVLAPRGRGPFARDPGGRVLTLGASPWRVLLRDGASPGLVSELAGHRGAVRRASVGAERQVLATGGDDGLVRLFDPADGARRGVVAVAAGQVADLALATEAPRLALLDGSETVHLVELPPAAAVGALAEVRARPWRVGTALEAVGLGPRGEVLATFLDGPLVSLREEREPHTELWLRSVDIGQVPDLTLVPEADLWLVTARNGVRAWRLGDGQPIPELQLDAGVRARAVSRDGRWLALARGAGVDLFALAPVDRWGRIPSPGGVVEAVAFTDGGASVVFIDEGGERHLVPRDPEPAARLRATPLAQEVLDRYRAAR